MLVNGSEIHLTTFEDEGRGPFRYETASVAAFKTAVKALPVEGPLGQLTLFKCLDADQHGAYELYRWSADYKKQKGFARDLVSETAASLKQSFRQRQTLSFIDGRRR